MLLLWGSHIIRSSSSRYNLRFWYASSTSFSIMLTTRWSSFISIIHSLVRVSISSHALIMAALLSHFRVVILLIVLAHLILVLLVILSVIWILIILIHLLLVASDLGIWDLLLQVSTSLKLWRILLLLSLLNLIPIFIWFWIWMLLLLSFLVNSWIFLIIWF